MSIWKILFGDSNAIKQTTEAVSDLAKDVKTLATGKLDPEKAANILLEVSKIELEFQKVQSQVIIAEAQGSFLQRNWRPVMMWVFLVLVILDVFNLLPNKLAPEAWTLLQIGLGGYAVGRSIEKVAKVIKT